MVDEKLPMQISHRYIATSHLEMEISMKCLNCGCENNITDTRCRLCGYELNHKQIMKTEESINDEKEYVGKADYVTKSSEVKKNTKIIAFLPWCIGVVVALIFLIVGLGNTIAETYKAKGYLETEGTLAYVKYEKDKLKVTYKSISKGGYTGVYQYVVDGQTYMGSPNKVGNSGDIKDKVKVKYNPNNPSEYVISGDWAQMNIMGIIILGVIIVAFVQLKKHKKQEYK